MLEGNLSDVAVAELIQYICRQHKPARLIIQHQGRQAYLFFKEGNIIHATLGDIQGEIVIYAVLRWRNGYFKLEMNIESPATTIYQTWFSLLKKITHLSNETELAASRAEVGKIHKEANGMVQDLEKILAGLADELPGFIAAAVIDMDGLNIAQYTQSGQLNIEESSAQMALFFKLVETSVTKLHAGEVEDNLLTTENAYLLMWFINGLPYFLGIAVDRRRTLLGHLRLIGRLYMERVAKVMLLYTTSTIGELYEQVGEITAAGPG